MASDGQTIFNPSTLQNIVEDQNDKDEDDVEDQIQIERQIEERLGDMDGEELDLNEDDDDSITDPYPSRPDQFQHFDAQTFQTGQFYQSSALYGTENVSSQINSNGVSPHDERQFLLLNRENAQESLEILYHARGQEIKRLQEALNEVQQSRGTEVRQLRHELALLKGDKNRLEANLEHLGSVAQGQSEENRELRIETENLRSRIDACETTKRELMNQQESSDLLIKTLQGQLTDLQKSETVLKAKQHYEQVVSSLKDRHETESYNMQQENDRLNSKIKLLESELESSKLKSFKEQRQMEMLIIEKSDTIKDLQYKLEASQRQFADHMSQSSAQGYVNIRAMHEQLKMDQEKYAQDILNYQSEIDQLRKNFRKKDDENILLQRSFAKFKVDHEELLRHKSEMIINLQQRLTDSEKRVAHGAAENTKQESVEKLKQDVRRLSSELEKAHLDLHERETEIASLFSKLHESIEKYQGLKKKVRQYQAHCKSKELKYNELIRSTEADFKQKLNLIQDKVEECYSSKEKQLESEVNAMRRFFDDELNKILRMDPAEQNPNSPHSPDLQVENFGPQLRSRASTTPSVRSREDLDRILKAATLDIKDQLKMPSERFPLSQKNYERL